MSFKPSRTFQVVNAVVALLLLLSAVLQYNDPDPLPWIAIYVLAAAACLIDGSTRIARLLPALVGIGALVWAGSLAPRVLPVFEAADLVRSMKAETMSIEQSRELLGLLTIAGWMGVLAVTRWRRSSAEAA